jgi:hypothetical protein
LRRVPRFEAETERKGYADDLAFSVFRDERRYLHMLQRSQAFQYEPHQSVLLGQIIVENTDRCRRPLFMLLRSGSHARLNVASFQGQLAEAKPLLALAENVIICLRGGANAPHLRSKWILRKRTHPLHERLSVESCAKPRYGIIPKANTAFLSSRKLKHAEDPSQNGDAR